MHVILKHLLKVIKFIWITNNTFTDFLFTLPVFYCKKISWKQSNFIIFKQKKNRKMLLRINIQPLRTSSWLKKTPPLAATTALGLLGYVPTSFARCLGMFFYFFPLTHLCQVLQVGGRCVLTAIFQSFSVGFRSGFELGHNHFCLTFIFCLGQFVLLKGNIYPKR